MNSAFTVLMDRRYAHAVTPALYVIYLPDDAASFSVWIVPGTQIEED
jgi:hypothetical protein